MASASPILRVEATTAETMEVATLLTIQAELVSPSVTAEEKELQQQKQQQPKTSSANYHQLQPPTESDAKTRAEDSNILSSPDQGNTQVLQTDNPRDSNNKNNNNSERMEAQNDDEDDDDDYIDVSFWDILASCSMILLWLQRSTFGIVSLVRSLLLGHCLRLLVANYANNPKNNNDSRRRSTNRANDNNSISHTIRDWTQKYLALVYEFVLGGGDNSSSHYVFPSSTHSSHKQIQAWPPPALVVLAILTIAALVVHPDGMTWIVLRKIRDTMVLILESSKTCWNTSVRDYGMVKTVSASASIFMLFVAAIVMHKAFLSNFNHCFGGGSGKEHSTVTSSKQRRNGNSTAADKKRRRRKGHHSSKHQQHHNRIRTGSSGGGSSILPCPRLPKVEEVSSDGAASEISSNGGGKDVVISNNTDTAIESAKQDDMSNPSMMTQEEEAGSIMTSPSVLESVVSSDETEVKGRGSIPSVCTVDTMSDDISCGSMSVRSAPPPRQQQQQQPVWSRGNAITGKSSNNTRGKKASSNKLSRGQKQTKAASKTATQSTPFTRSDFGKAARGLETTTYSSTETRQDSSNKMGYAGQKQSRGGKGRAGGDSQSSRDGRNGKGGRSKKTQKHSINSTRTSSPLPTSTNNSVCAATIPKSDGTVISAASTTDSLTSNGNNSNRIPPVSPYSQSLFSCEVGNSGWSLPALPSSGQYRKPTLEQTTLASPVFTNQTNSSVDPYSQLSPETPADLDCGLWDTGSSRFNNSTQSTPQRPLRAPPGLPTPAAILNTPIRSSNEDLYEPINTPSNNHNNTAPAMIPITPSFGTPITSQNNSVPYSWSGMGMGNAATSTGDASSRKDGHRSALQENPFAVESMYTNNNYDDADNRIEAELQELGGQMIGSVLDF